MLRRPDTHSNCNGLSRRNFLQLGLGTTAGIGLSQIQQLRAQAAAATGKLSPDSINCILVWLDGGPTHHESFDPKPSAPSGIRGDLLPIPTSVPGVHFSEAVPHLAKVADKLTVVRSICHHDPNHGGGNHYMMTGAPTPVPVNCGAHVSFHPSFGAVASHTRGLKDGLPAYISLDRQSRSGGPNFLGAANAPFIIKDDPNRSAFRVRDIAIPTSLTDGRAESRHHLRASLDKLERFHDPSAADPTLDFDSYYSQGIDLVTSPAAQAAFNIGAEPAKTRDLYGRNRLGQRLLLARRLVEVGVSFVTCYYGGWDHHVKIFDGLKKHMPPLDQGLAALISDLDDRGLLDSTLVICLGEFGR
ncbi:MAG: DUF1501 domain-containing protein, partial [Verrucomicrobiales bacterium]|nr:DUF1501 domain-containing protein [Verrucomicrobiales bacterium]